MPTWVVPALKAVLPHVGDIVSATRSVLTHRKSDGEAPTTTQQQIDELQGLASQNTAYIKDLAEQLQNTVTALEKAAEAADARLRRITALAIFATGAAAISLVVALVTALTR